MNVLNGYRERLCECVKWTQGERCVNVLNEYRERVRSNCINTASGMVQVE